MPPADQKSVVTVRISEAMKASLQKAADEKGGNLSAEILHRLAEYESQRDFIDRLLDDSAAISLALSLATMRKGVIATPAFGASDGLLKRAVVTATCLSQLFAMVADHASNARARNIMAQLLKIWTERIEAGEITLKNGQDTAEAREEASKTFADITLQIIKIDKKLGKDLASHVGALIGPTVWNVCFNKGDPHRDDQLTPPPVALPPGFLRRQPAEEEHRAIVESLKDIGLLRDAAKGLVGDGKDQGTQEDEVTELFYENLLKQISMDSGEAVPDAKAS